MVARADAVEYNEVELDVKVGASEAGWHGDGLWKLWC